MSTNRQPTEAAAAAAATANVDAGIGEVAVAVGIGIVAANSAPAPCHFSIDYIEAATAEKFQIGMTFESKESIEALVDDFANEHGFVVSNRQLCNKKCSRAATYKSKTIAAGEYAIGVKSTSLVTDCPWEVKWSSGKKTEITRVNGMHNHACDIASEVMAIKKSGKAVQTAVSQVTAVLAPLLNTDKNLDCDLIRNIIRPYVSPEIILDDKNIRSIMRGAYREMEAGNYKAPAPIIGLNELKAFSSVDFSSANCGKVLDELLSNANTNGDNSWIVTRLMNRLKSEDPYFDFRLQYDEDDHVVAVTWQIGASRGALMKYGDKVFLDTRNNENMNCINMQYMTFVVIDGNKEMIPASESFVFQESKELYGVVVNFTLDMTPNFAKESVKLGFSDLFISPQDAKMWFPNVTWLVDTYHFCSPSKKDSVLAKSFGPKFWHLIASDMRAAVYADTEDDCLVCIEAAIAKVSSSQATIDNIVQWQERRSDWAMYKRNDVKGHMCICGPYAEQNHSSLVALVKDDKNRTLEVNIRDVMRRTELIVQKKQQANFKHQAEAHNDLIKAYGGRYLFCTLLNDRGWPLCVNQGHTTVAYENVFLSEIGAIQGIQKCDYIFYKQMQVPLVTCSSRPIVEVASSTQTRVADVNNASSDSDDDIILSDLARTSTLKNANAKRTSESTDLQEHPAKRPNSNQK
mmetsp:Transcript_8058/g.13712  ORF Transcript_8058/g.13712 Transcript_8058/m.13712 type:complete len:688 (-) Transcript_8058:40-2103(-)